MKTFLRTLVLVPLAGLMGIAAPPPALPLVGSHTWDFSEVFSSGDGLVQFIELKECCGGPGETGLPGHTLTSGTRTWVIPGGPLTPPTSSRHYLIATPAFAALPGAPTPDAIIPSNHVPFVNVAGDSLSYIPWDTWTFGALPTNGVNSLKRSGTVSVNDPTNYAGTSGSVNASLAVPALTGGSLVVLVGGVLLAGVVLLLARRGSS